MFQAVRDKSAAHQRRHSLATEVCRCGDIDFSFTRANGERGYRCGEGVLSCDNDKTETTLHKTLV